eukprot:339722_1
MVPMFMFMFIKVVSMFINKSGLKVVSMFIKDHDRVHVLYSKSKCIYFVHIGHEHYCSCHVFSNRGTICKHIIWTLHCLLGMRVNSPAIYQDGLTQYELDDIYDDAPPSPSDLHASSTIKDRLSNW